MGNGTALFSGDTARLGSAGQGVILLFLYHLVIFIWVCLGCERFLMHKNALLFLVNVINHVYPPVLIVILLKAHRDTSNLGVYVP